MSDPSTKIIVVGILILAFICAIAECTRGVEETKRNLSTLPGAVAYAQVPTATRSRPTPQPFYTATPTPPRPTPYPAPDCDRDVCIFLPVIAESQSATVSCAVYPDAIIITDRLDYGVGPGGVHQYGVHGPLALDVTQDGAYWMQSAEMYAEAVQGAQCACVAPVPLLEQWCTTQVCCS